MNNDEIKALLRELSDKAAAEGKVKSRVVDITFDKKKPSKRRAESSDEGDSLSDDAGQSESDALQADDEGEQDRKRGRKQKKSLKSVFSSGVGAITGRKKGNDAEESEEEDFLDEPEDEADVFISVLPKSDGRFVVRDYKNAMKPADQNTDLPSEKEDNEAEQSASVDAAQDVHEQNTAMEADREPEPVEEEGHSKKRKWSLKGLLQFGGRNTSEEDDFEEEDTDDEDSEEEDFDDASEEEDFDDSKSQEQAFEEQEPSDTDADPELAEHTAHEASENKNLYQDSAVKAETEMPSMRRIYSTAYAPDFESDAQDFRSAAETDTKSGERIGERLKSWLEEKKSAQAEKKARREAQKAEAEADPSEKAEEEKALPENPAEEEPAEINAKAAEVTAEEESPEKAEPIQEAETERQSDSAKEETFAEAAQIAAETENADAKTSDEREGEESEEITDTDSDEKPKLFGKIRKPKKEKEPKQPKEAKEPEELKEPKIRRAVGRFSLKEKIMFGVGAILAVLIVIMVISILSNRKKSEHVASESGLSVTVEKEPQTWCNAGEVTLGIRTSSAIQSVTVNGKPQEFEGKKSTEITLTAEDHNLSVMVVSEEKVLNALVQLQKLDSEDPTLTISTQNGVVSLEAADSESGLEGVYYGVLEGLSDVVEYERYTGPFVPVEGKMYSCYAKDIAGNTTTPVVTNLTAAESISLKKDEIVLFPGDTYRLSPVISPEGAYVNGMKMECSDTNVISLDENGLITALADGEAQVTISAPGLTNVSCIVRVRTEIDVTLSAVGDMTLGDDVSFNTSVAFSTAAKTNGLGFFLKNVKSIFEADDITFANFEGTLTEQGKRANKTYAFKGSPSYTQILTDGSVEAVTLANNHSRDYGDVSLEDTEKYLAEAGISYCIGDIIAIEEVNGIKVALIGIYGLDDNNDPEQLMKAAIAQAKEQGADIIVTAFHWGSEKASTPDAKQQSLAHAAIDAGADLVVGHHPHVLQGIELYNGKYIAYSLGNFCFGGNSTPSDKDTIILQAVFTMTAGGNISDTKLNVIPCSISSESSYNNYQPTPAAGSEAERIRTKLNELCEPYGTSF